MQKGKKGIVMNENELAKLYKLTLTATVSVNDYSAATSGKCDVATAENYEAMLDDYSTAPIDKC